MKAEWNESAWKQTEQTHKDQKLHKKSDFYLFTVRTEKLAM